VMRTQRVTVTGHASTGDHHSALGRGARRRSDLVCPDRMVSTCHGGVTTLRQKRTMQATPKQHQTKVRTTNPASAMPHSATVGKPAPTTTISVTPTEAPEPVEVAPPTSPTPPTVVAPAPPALPTPVTPTPPTVVSPAALSPTIAVPASVSSLGG
jgi:hypothetical protein